MSGIIYTVARDVEPTGLSLSSASVDVNGTDESYNSTPDDLSIFTNGRWLNVVGFTTAANNGWHNIDAATTSAKVQVAEDLTTEAAGDSVVLTEYYRGVGESNSMDVIFLAITRSTDFIKNTNRSLDGTPESILHRSDIFWDVNTDLILIDLLPEYREWIGSVGASEIFTFDPYGTISSPDSPMLVELDSQKFIESRSEEGQPDSFTISLRVREI